jgi:hypothetical protein|tara:strand:- start:2882 stop:3250 length:369 start_codon:yes stop_codon:yes gene_type:complete
MVLKDIQKNFPFINVVNYGGKDYIGIIINQDQAITSMYDYNALRSNEERKLFLNLGNTWWWESNRMIPINIFLREMNALDYTIVFMNTKDVNVTLGTTVNLNNLTIKRVKRKSVQLIRKPKN